MKIKFNQSQGVLLVLTLTKKIQPLMPVHAQFINQSLSLSLSHAHTHTHTHTRARACFSDTPRHHVHTISKLLLCAFVSFITFSINVNKYYFSYPLTASDNLALRAQTPIINRCRPCVIQRSLFMISQKYEPWFLKCENCCTFMRFSVFCKFQMG